jgi:hypothetical protein
LSGKAVLTTKRAVLSTPSHDNNVMSPGSITALIVCMSLLVIAVLAALVVWTRRTSDCKHQSKGIDGEEGAQLRCHVDDLSPGGVC